MALSMRWCPGSDPGENLGRAHESISWALVLQQGLMDVPGSGMVSLLVDKVCSETLCTQLATLRKSKIISE